MAVLKTLILPAVALLVGCLVEQPPELYLIPKGYIGPVVVAFEQTDGVAPQIYGDTLVYEIPESGVLRTQAAYPRGILDVSYAFVDSAGRRFPLPDDNPNVEVPEDVVQVFKIIGGYLGELVDPPGDTLYVKGGWSTDERSPSLRFLVGKRTDRDSLIAQRERLEQSITRTVIIEPELVKED